MKSNIEKAIIMENFQGKTFKNSDLKNVKTIFDNLVHFNIANRDICDIFSSEDKGEGKLYRRVRWCDKDRDRDLQITNSLLGLEDKSHCGLQKFVVACCWNSCTSRVNFNSSCFGSVSFPPSSVRLLGVC